MGLDARPLRRGRRRRRLSRADHTLIDDVARKTVAEVLVAVEARAVDGNDGLTNALKQRFKPSNIIGNSKSMQDVYELIHKVAGTKATVLILGESGVGKELVANALHYNSLTADGPFIKFNCAASCSATRKARSQAPSRCARAVSRWPTAARSSSTRSAS